MARVVQTEKVKKGKKNKILIIVGIILVLVVASLLLYKFFFKKGESRTRIEVKVLDSMEEYGYSLSDNDSKFYKIVSIEIIYKMHTEKTLDFIKKIGIIGVVLLAHGVSAD